MVEKIKNKAVLNAVITLTNHHHPFLKGLDLLKTCLSDHGRRDQNEAMLNSDHTYKPHPLS